ncbi:hypothetical protein KIN20_029486 [Parelaphostrongylus tenuis]|uniref:Uncharacterized protein n=1 Tax=Parelaphostrongylus tenuis TaxID=148309 RepID=A0AAD5R2H6_PARTN|nr:hypothetical protein KIN20_029486 [Parelaphostrongylus tenuis]
MDICVSKLVWFLAILLLMDIVLLIRDAKAKYQLRQAHELELCPLYSEKFRFLQIKRGERLILCNPESQLAAETQFMETSFYCLIHIMEEQLKVARKGLE